MRRLVFLLFIGVYCSLQAQDMRTLFVEAPDSVFPLQPKRMRVELAEFAAAGMRYNLSNVLDGKSVIESVTDDYMLLRSSGVSTMQLRKLPLGDSFLICVVNTVVAEAADSRIAFFDSKWRRLPTGDFFAFPQISEFFVSSDAATSADAGLCDIYLVELLLGKDDNSLVTTYTMPDYMSDEDAGKVRPLLREIVFHWNGNRFVSE